MKRFLTLKDKFKIMCRQCNSEDVDLSVEDCVECGDTVLGVCNKCGSKYSYHAFESIEEG